MVEDACDPSVAQALAALLETGVDEASLDADRASAAVFAERLGGSGRPVTLSGDLARTLGTDLPDGLWCLCEPETVAAVQALDVACGAEAAVTATRASLADMLDEVDDPAELRSVGRAAGRLALRAPAPFAVGAVGLAGSRAVEPGRLHDGVRALCAGLVEAGVHGLLLEDAPNGAVGFGAVRAASAVGLPVAALADRASLPDDRLLALTLAALVAAGACCAGVSSVPWDDLDRVGRLVGAVTVRCGASGAVVADAPVGEQAGDWPLAVVEGLGLVGVRGAPLAQAADLWASLAAAGE